jgi:hypothetical protein
MPVDTSTAQSSGPAFLIAAAFAYEVIAATNSSPQTTEINASTRAETLMKWVKIGTVQTAFFIGIAAYVDKKHRTEILAGGALGAGIMYYSYLHAKAAGLANPGPVTEG